MADDIRLVGGTFVTILEQYRKYKDEKRQNILKGRFVSAFFVALGFDEKECGDFSTAQATHFTRCDSETFEGSFIKLSNLESLAFSISKHWKDVSIFFENFMTENSEMKVVAALKEMIESDDTIKMTDRFLLSEDESITKKDVFKMETVPYIPFITGVAISSLKKDNSEGRITINKWSNYVPKAHAKTDVGKTYWGKIEDDVTYVDRIQTLNKSHDDNGNAGGTQSVDNCNVASGLEYSLSETDFNSFFKQKNIDDLITTVKGHKELYVETATYLETLERVLKLGCVMLTGNPGVGKTMTSEMVAVKMAGLGFEIHYTKGGYDTLYKIRDEVFREENKKRKDFILIDDCMGRAVFELSMQQENALQYFVAQVQNNKENKKLLLNSRIRVIQDLNEEEHEDCLNRYDEMLRRGQVVEAQKMPVIERAHLLRNHIFSRLSEEYYEDLSGDKCLDVVINPNFNPRVVDHATNPRYVVEIQQKGDFYWSLLDAFDDPEAVWRKIYYNEQATPDEAKVLFKSLFSVPQIGCDIKICRKIFEAYWNKEDSGRAWNNALFTQNGSTVKIVRKKDYQEHWYEDISLIDPSFADFLEKSIYRKGSPARNSLKDGVVYELQIMQVYDVLEEPVIKKQMALDGRLENLIYDSEISKIIDIFGYIALSKACREPLKKYFKARINNFRKGQGTSFHDGNHFVTDCSLMLVALISSNEMREFYLGGKISKQLYDYLTFYLSVDECLDILTAYLKNKDCFAFKYDRPEIERLIKNAVDDSLSECFSRDMESIEGPVDDSMLEECNIEVNEEIRNRCLQSLDSQKQNLPNDLFDFFTKTIKEHEDVDHTDRIKKYGEELEEYEDYDSYEEYEVTPEEINEVKALFSEKFSPRKEILI